MSWWSINPRQREAWWPLVLSVVLTSAVLVVADRWAGNDILPIIKRMQFVYPAMAGIAGILAAFMATTLGIVLSMNSRNIEILKRHDLLGRFADFAVGAAIVSVVWMTVSVAGLLVEPSQNTIWWSCCVAIGSIFLALLGTLMSLRVITSLGYFLRLHLK